MIIAELPAHFLPIAKKAAGMPLERRILPFAPQTFRAWFQQRGVHNQSRLSRKRRGTRCILSKSCR